MEDAVQGFEIVLFSSAARQDKPGSGQLHRFGQDLAEDIFDLACIDIFRLEGRKDIDRKDRAVRATCRGIFDHGDLSLGVAHDHVVIIDHSTLGALTIADHEQACDHDKKQGF